MKYISILLFSLSVYAAPEQDAYQSIFKAWYKQTNLEQQLKHIEKQYLNDDVKFYGGYVLLIAKMVEEKHLSCQWRF